MALSSVSVITCSLLLWTECWGLGYRAGKKAPGILFDTYIMPILLSLHKLVTFLKKLTFINPTHFDLL
jgi:hypothetical protein